MFSSMNEVQQYIAEHEIKMIDFKIIDLNGRWRHLTIPAGRFTEKVLEQGIGFDGSNYGFSVVEKSDMVFIPDILTASIEPFTDVPTISMLCDVLSITETGFVPFNQYPRNVARAAEEYLKSTDIADEVRLGPEYELYLLDTVSYETKPNCAGFSLDNEYADWNTGSKPNHGFQIPHHGAYHITPPQDFCFDLRNRIAVMLEERDIPIKYHHMEVGGPGQIEFEVQFGALTQMADRTLMTKYIIKNAAVREGLTATFMPKPIFGEAGNGMHVHIILTKDGEPVFYDKNGYSQLSSTALFFIGGLLKHAASLCALTNPSTNSYRRLVPGFEAPVTIGFATANRSSVIRIPGYAKSAADKRFELRNPDATCNPYYAFAAILMAGLDGVENGIDPIGNGWGPFDFNLYDLSDEEKKKIQKLPTSLDEALHALEIDHDYLLKGNVFSETLISTWIKQKKADINQVNSFPHPMEFQLYYDL